MASDLDRKKLTNLHLLLLCEEIGVETSGLKGKLEIVEALKLLRLEDGEREEAWELIQTRKEEPEHLECSRKEEAEGTERVHREQVEMRRQEFELERRGLDIEEKKASDNLARRLSQARELET